MGGRGQKFQKMFSSDVQNESYEPEPVNVFFAFEIGPRFEDSEKLTRSDLRFASTLIGFELGLFSRSLQSRSFSYSFVIKEVAFI